MHRAKLVFDLQGVDLQIDATTEALAQVEAQLGESPALLAARQALEERRHHRAQLESQLRTLEWQADDLAAKVATEEAKLYGGSVRNPKELASLHEEVEHLKKRRGEVEDRALDLMGQLEGLEKAIEQEASALAAEEAAWASAQARLAEEGERLRDAWQGLEEERRSQAAEMPPDDLDVYLRIRESRGGKGAVRIEQGRCGGCRINIPVSDLQRARSHDLVRCSSCGRILYAG